METFSHSKQCSTTLGVKSKLLARSIRTHRWQFRILGVAGVGKLSHRPGALSHKSATYTSNCATGGFDKIQLFITEITPKPWLFMFPLCPARYCVQARCHGDGRWRDNKATAGITGALDSGSPMSPVDFKKLPCPLSLFLKNCLSILTL